jgi:hypothetical protein
MNRSAENLARDAPVIEAPKLITAPPIETGISATVKHRKLITSRKPDTGIKRTRKPSQKPAKKPPQPSGYQWRRDGSGWELRKAVYDVSDTGIKKRRLPYLAHLSKSAFSEMKRKHRGAALEKAIARWIAEHDR